MNGKVTDERPTVRLSKIEISNFMNVEHGEIEFPDNQPDDGLFHSSIVGLYGQNGSGKSALVRSLSILKDWCGEGRAIGSLKGSQLIRFGCSSADFSYEFVLLYPNGDFINATYSLSISSVIVDEITTVQNEELKCKGFINGNKVNSHIVVVSNNEKGRMQHRFKNTIVDDDKSMFNSSFISIVQGCCSNQKEEKDIKVFEEIYRFIKDRLFVVESSRIVDLGVGEIVLGLGSNVLSLEYDNDSNIDNLHSFDYTIDEIKAGIEKLSRVFQIVVPGVNIHLGNSDSPRILLSERSGVSIPFSQESYGIRKIFSVIQHLINAYNLDSYMLVVDEFDEGIFEFLLGQILGIIKKGGHGQLLFTSHNLRPLEVLGKENIFFTTANPSNRYLRMIKIKPHNNLRDTYFRAIQLGGQKEELYNDTDEDDIETAFILAGGLDNE